jgi:hypothetical protein
MQAGFPKPTRGDAHRWYKNAILEWERGVNTQVPPLDEVQSERLTPNSVTLIRGGRTVRPSRKAGAMR